jgi:hypothetical protein
VDDINAIAYVVRSPRSLGQPKAKAKSGRLGPDCGMELGWMKLDYMSAIWCAGSFWAVVIIDARRGIIEVFVRLV